MRDNRHIFILALLLLLILAMPVRAEDDVASTTPQELIIIDRGKIAEVLRSDMIMLDDNRRYRLDNIRIPPYEDSPAREELERTFLNANVIVYTYHNIDDDDEKHTVPLAHIVTDKGVWIQQELILKGLAWAYSTESSQQTVGILKQAEEKARFQHKGFWGNPAYAIKTPEAVKDYINSYQIVEGKILSVVTKANSGIVFFNFGKDWKHDFTVQFQANHFLSFIEDPTTGERTTGGVQKWKGRLVRVRGWVTKVDTETKENTGPTMVLTHKDQIDLLPLYGQ